MHSSFSRLTLSTALAIGLSSFSFSCAAQTTPSSGPSSTVVYVGGNDLVLKASNGMLLNYMVSSSDRFPAGGKQMTLAQLKPGTTLTQPVVSAVKPKVVASVAVVKGKVYAIAPPDAVTLSLTEGIKELVVPAGTTFMVAGQPKTVAELKPDMMVEATVVTTVAEGAAPDPSASAALTTPPMEGALLVANTLAAGDAELPLAGTNLPLYGVLGISLMTLGAGLFFFRRPATTA